MPLLLPTLLYILIPSSLLPLSPLSSRRHHPTNPIGSGGRTACDLSHEMDHASEPSSVTPPCRLASALPRHRNHI
jgi:hypothetical protein